MLKCKICGNELVKNQKSTCSRKCRNEYVKKLNTGRLSPFKGKNRWTDEQKKRIGEIQRGRILSEETKRKISEANKGQIPWIKGKKHTEASIRMFSGKNNGNWTGGRDRYKRKEALRRYNISIEKFDEMLDNQKGLCAICGKQETVKKYLSVDHDHDCCPSHVSCGECVRGLLCHRCNKMLGMAQDSIEILESAIEYLKRTA